jgi:hypothetical protein
VIRFYFNGQAVNSRIDGLDDFTIELAQPEENMGSSLAVSTEVTFYDTAYETIYQTCIRPVNGIWQTITVSIYDECCEQFLPQKFYIRGDKVEWCEAECYCTVVLIPAQPDRDIVNCIKSTVVSDDRNGYFSSREFNKVPYCIEYRPSILQDTVIILTILVLLIVDYYIILFTPVILSIIAAIYAFCLALVVIQNAFNFFANAFNSAIQSYNSIPILPNLNWHINPINIVSPFCQQLIFNPGAIINDIKDFYQRLIDNVIGCGRKHPTPYVRDYIENVCTICGASGFSSSILNNPASEYYNSMYWYAPSKKGDRTPPKLGIEKANRPMDKGDAFLGKLAQEFNAEWWVDNGVLYFESKYYWQNLPVFFDTTNNPSALLERPCYNYNANNAFAAQTVKYQIDGIDWVGDEAINEHQYHINYALTYGYNPAWVDCNVKDLLFGADRYREDGIERDVLSDYGSIGLVNTFLGGQLTATNDFQLLNNGTATLPKLIIADTYNYPVNNMRVKDYPGRGRNYPYRIDPTQTGNLWDFHKLDDPTINAPRLFDFNFTAKLDCAHLGTLTVRQTVVLRPRDQSAPPVLGYLKRISLNLGKRQMKLYGEVA